MRKQTQYLLGAGREGLRVCSVCVRACVRACVLRDSVRRWRCVPPSAGFESLGVKPRKLEGITLDYLRAFRAGGYAYGTEAGVM